MARRDKRSPFITELCEAAKSRDFSFRYERWHGKGRHGMVFVGDKSTTVPNRVIDPKTASKIKNVLATLMHSRKLWNGASSTGLS